MIRPLSRPLKALLWTGALLALVVVVVLALRKPLLARALQGALREAGATGTRFVVTTAAPWRVQVDELGFTWQRQEFSAQRVTVDRPKWWGSTLGDVRIERARLPLSALGAAGGGTGGGTAPARVPVDQVSLDGVLVVGDAAREVAIRFAAKQDEAQRWSGSAEAKAGGLAVVATGSYDHREKLAGVRVEHWEVDLALWGEFLQGEVPLPEGPWTLGGVVSGDARADYVDGKLAAAGRVAWRGGRAGSEKLGLQAEGIEADFEFTDLFGLRSKPGTLHVRELRAAGLKAGSVEIAAALAGPDRIEVSEVRLEALGGRLAAESFIVAPASGELAATLTLDGVRVEEVLALAPEVPATATGLVDGRVPLTYGPQGLQFGRGWLELKRGSEAELQLHAAGLLTGGVAPSSASYPTLKKIEAGLLRLRLTELRLDLRPANAPPGRTATLHVAGEPVDPEVKAPVKLDLNVNGPVERLLNLGLDGRVKFRTGN